MIGEAWSNDSLRVSGIEVEYIHPFYDGNGRTGRFIVSCYLSQEFSPYIALQLSVEINKRKNAYYKMFEETNSQWNRGDLTPFILQFMEFISLAFDDTISLLSRKKEQLKRFAAQLWPSLSIIAGTCCANLFWYCSMLDELSIMKRTSTLLL